MHGTVNPVTVAYPKLDGIHESVLLASEAADLLWHIAIYDCIDEELLDAILPDVAERLRAWRAAVD